MYEGCERFCHMVALTVGPAEHSICPALANSVDADQLASEEANCCRSALLSLSMFACEPLKSSNLTD